MVFGQLVVGPPGSGKTTYCNGMQQFLRLAGRKVAVINLDPANDALAYDCAVDVGELVRAGGGAAAPTRAAQQGGRHPLSRTRTHPPPRPAPVSLEAVQRELGLGPNGGLLYCMEYLEANLDWLRERLAPLEAGARAPRAPCAPGASPLPVLLPLLLSLPPPPFTSQRNKKTTRPPHPPRPPPQTTTCSSTCPARWSSSRCTARSSASSPR